MGEHAVYVTETRMWAGWTHLPPPSCSSEFGLCAVRPGMTSRTCAARRETTIRDLAAEFSQHSPGGGAGGEGREAGLWVVFHTVPRVHVFVPPIPLTPPPILRCC